MTKNSIDCLISLIFTSRRLIRARAKNFSKLHPFSFLQFETLRYVAEKSNPPMSAVADYFGITPPSATSLIGCLVKSGHLKRITDAGDRRIVRLAITPKGRGKIEEMTKSIMLKMRKFFMKLSEQERLQLIKILEKISS